MSLPTPPIAFSPAATTDAIASVAIRSYIMNTLRPRFIYVADSADITRRLIRAYEASSAPPEQR